MSDHEGQHYFSATPTGPEHRRRLDVEVWGRRFALTSANGVFAGDGLDRGTEILLRECPPPTGQPAVLDLGCGYGPVALGIALACPGARVDAVDVNERALALCRDNAAELGVAGRVRVLLPDEVEAGRAYDEIWSNPPIRIGKQALHDLLLRAAHHELDRRRAALSHVRGEELDDIAMQSADDALVAVLSKLDTFRGASRFTTWAYKFALLEAGVKLRRRAWQGREVVLEPEGWTAFADTGATAHETLERAELMSELSRAIAAALTPHQRTVFVALALNEVPIDVLAERLGTTRGALYKTLHDARKKLRSELEEE